MNIGLIGGKHQARLQGSSQFHQRLENFLSLLREIADTKIETPPIAFRNAQYTPTGVAFLNQLAGFVAKGLIAFRAIGKIVVMNIITFFDQASNETTTTNFIVRVRRQNKRGTFKSKTVHDFLMPFRG